MARIIVLAEVVRNCRLFAEVVLQVIENACGRTFAEVRGSKIKSLKTLAEVLRKCGRKYTIYTTYIYPAPALLAGGIAGREGQFPIPGGRAIVRLIPNGHQHSEAEPRNCGGSGA